MYKTIRPAQIYKPAGDLWVITSFFNSENYLSKQANYHLFTASLEKSGINYLVVECAFSDQPFQLPDSPHVLRVRSKSILWQKERLLNLALSALPTACTKVAWIDCDVLFENERWAADTSACLNHYVVAQPFDRVIRLPQGSSFYEGEGDTWESFAAVHQRRQGRRPEGDFSRHGHCGFAWAVRRDVIAKYGFYDKCLSGSADHLMMHAFSGDLYSNCIYNMLGRNRSAHRHYRDWGRAIYRDVSGKIGCVPGALLHLWHGDLVNRQYGIRNLELAKFKFNPYDDIFINEEGCLEWTSNALSKNLLPAWAKSYHATRKEDG